MDADWYEDPLDRFDGRFFDGERWTERVSVDGAPAIDPDFPTQPSPATDPGVGAEDHVDDAPARAAFDASGAPAVAPVGRRTKLKASLIEESPTRTVAVLDSNVAAPQDGSPDPGNRSVLVWGLLGLVGVLAVVGLLVWRSSDDSGPAVAEAVDLDAQQEERVQDLAEGGTDAELETDVIEELDVDAPIGVVETDAVFDRSELVEVGSLRLLNGASVLRDLEEWHRAFAADRGVVLGPEAGCWFGQLGDAAVQVAQCGPVGGSAATEFLFDLVPLLFEDVDDGQIAQPVVDAVTIDAVLANALSLVGSPDGPTPPG